MNQTMGEVVSKTLEDVENLLWAYAGEKADLTDNGFRAAVKIFMDALLDKMFDLQEKENIAMEDRVKMAEKVGNEVRNLIKTYTDIDTHKMYDECLQK